MIFWFSGTGNSYAVAQRLAAASQDKLYEMTVPLSSHHRPSPSASSVGFVFPVYGWGLPLVVSQFLRHLPSPASLASPAYVYAVLTCGDDIGRTDVLLRKALAKRGWHLDAVFSVQMRNTYVCLPGFDTDSPDVVKQKAQAMEQRMKEITACISRFGTTGPEDVHPGAFPGLKSHVLRPLFNTLLTSDRHFRVNKDSCISCGKCVNSCPLHNILLDNDGFPQWNGNCTHCLRCFHVCPRHAVDYGFFTRGKGQVKIKF